MTEPPAMAAPAAPGSGRKRRWLQFSLRGMLLLTTAIAAWLIHHSRQHAAEEEVLAQARALDKDAHATWQAPQWWCDVFGERPAGIFARISDLTLCGSRLTAEQIATLPIGRLQQLKELSILSRVISNEEADDLSESWNHVEIRLFSMQTNDRPSDWTVDAYLRDPSPIAAAQVRESVQNYTRDAQRAGTEPDVLSYGCIGTCDAGELSVGQLLTARDESLRVCSAYALWKLHSRVYARHVIDFAAGLEAKDKDCARLKKRVDRDLQPERILAELHHGDHDWGAWLASLRPHPELTDALIQAVNERRATLSTLYALGKSKDPRAVAPLILALSDSQLGSDYVAERALAPFASAELERQLLAGFSQGNVYYACRAASVLGKIGSSRSVPTLQQMATDPQYDHAPINVHNVSDLAAKAIKSREARNADPVFQAAMRQAEEARQAAEAKKSKSP